ncbi:RND transporter [Geomonas silvestris]|uniref:RND transporter n=1 Tax=Geomonas silvestris TaxID=2740184 RepID=A0A6V8MQ13_9BACT|nr:TolC family protein [Geomonas silvestris]GFO61709.1 RND transporter [Geomonas silvestris]
MHARFVTTALLIALLAVRPVQAAEHHSTQTENLNLLIETALTGNPELKASASRWEMFKSRVKQAGSWEDPMLMLKIQNGIVTDPLNFTRDSMTQKVIGIAQQIPYFGKTALREEVALHEAEAQHFAHGERRLEITRMVKEAYYQIGSIDHELYLLQKNIDIMDTFITLAETKYSVGQGAQQDIFKAQLERSKMLDMKITLEQQRKSQAIALNALLYRPADTPVGEIPEFGIDPALPRSQDLVTLAEENRPALKGLAAQVLKGRGSEALARKESYPDFNVSFEYMQRQPAMGSDGSDMYSLGVTFNLPVRKERRQAMVAEANSEVAMATEEMNATRNTISSGIADLLSQMERRRQLVDLYKNGIIPQAEQALESATIGYRVNKVDFLTLLDSRVNLYNFEHQYYDSIADFQMKKAQLEALVGGSLSGADHGARPTGEQMKTSSHGEHLRQDGAKPQP